MESQDEGAGHGNTEVQYTYHNIVLKSARVDVLSDFAAMLTGGGQFKHVQLVWIIAKMCAECGVLWSPCRWDAGSLLLGDSSIATSIATKEEHHPGHRADRLEEGRS
uniref:AP-2 complex subunit mu-B isoform X4 n=1 Tax=Monopterus albus TaxID=43700 RepID=UPI0009B43A6D|nr:uncharacterized protein LOC109972725 isoform X4 [Monopterus albus]